jgi:hypothetical protein
MGSNFVLKKLFPNCRLALSAGERIPVLSRKFFWTCGRIEYRAWLGSSMQIKIHRTWNRSYSRKRKRSDHFRGDTHNANDILYTTHTQFVKTRDSLVSGKKKKKQKTNSLFFFSLWGWRCFVVVGRMKLFVSNGMQEKNPISPRSEGSSF